MTPTVNSSTAAPRNRPIRWSPDYNKNKSKSNWTEAQTSQKILQEKKKKKKKKKEKETLKYNVETKVPLFSEEK